MRPDFENSTGTYLSQYHTNTLQNAKEPALRHLAPPCIAASLSSSVCILVHSINVIRRLAWSLQSVTFLQHYLCDVITLISKDRIVHRENVVWGTSVNCLFCAKHFCIINVQHSFVRLEIGLSLLRLLLSILALIIDHFHMPGTVLGAVYLLSNLLLAALLLGICNYSHFTGSLGVW